jgi:phosphate transport system protein
MDRAMGDELAAALVFQLADMCAAAGQAMEHATHALLRADIAMAEAVIDGQEHAAALNSGAEETAFMLLTFRPLMVADLREIANAIQIAADAERMGDLAVRVAEIARRHHPDPAVPAQVRGRVAELSASAVALAYGAQEVLLSRDPRLAVELCRDGDAVTDLHRGLLAVLIDPQWRYGVAAGVGVALVSRLFERFAGHAERIAERFVFPIDGQYRNKKVGKPWSKIAGRAV